MVIATRPRMTRLEKRGTLCISEVTNKAALGPSRGHVHQVEIVQLVLFVSIDRS